MEHKQKSTPIWLTVSGFLLEHKKIIWGFLILLVIAAGVAGGLVYYRSNLKEANADQFYKIMLHDLAKDSTTDANASLLNYVNSGSNFLDNKQFYNSFTSLLLVRRYIDSDNTADALKLLNENNISSSDELFNDFLHIEKSKKYLALKKYDLAVAEASSIKSPDLEDMQLFILARVYIEKGEISNAVNNINDISKKFPNSPIAKLAQGYLYLTN